MSLKTLFNDIADAIREKDGTTEPIVASDFPERIRALTCGSANQRNVFGVVWDYSDSSPDLTRLTPNTDPYGITTTAFSSWSVLAQIGDAGGYSIFDDYMPWAGMKEYNIINGVVGPKKGETGFSRTEYDTMIYIPEFWYQCIDDEEKQKRYWYVSDSPNSYLSKHPGSGKYIARYEIGGNSYSKSGLFLTRGSSLDVFRENAVEKGPGWRLCDYKVYCAVALLALVEFATWDLGHKIGPGNVNGGFGNPGMTDTMTYHTGSPGIGGNYAMQYRGIENLYGNLWKAVDGILCGYYKIFMCDDPEKYSSTIDSNYLDTGMTTPTSDGFVSKLWFSGLYKWAFIPKIASGSVTTYTTDDYYYNPSETNCYTVGDNYHGYGSGIAAVANYFSVGGNIQFGSRLLFDLS